MDYTKPPKSYTQSQNADPSKAIFGEQSRGVMLAQAKYNADNLAGITAGTVTPLNVDGRYGPLTQAALNPAGTGIVGTGDIHDQAKQDSAALDTHLTNGTYNPQNPNPNTPGDKTEINLATYSDPYTQGLQGIADRSNEATKRLIATISAKHENEVNQITQNYDKYARGMELLGIENGTAQFTPEILKGQLLEIKNQKMSKIHSLDQEMAGAIADADAARADNDFKVLKEKMQYVKELKKDRADAIKDLANNDTDMMKKAQFFGDTIYDAIKGLNGAQKATALSSLSEQLGIPVAYLIGASSSVAQDRIKAAPKASAGRQPTAAERKSAVIGALNKVFSGGGKDSTGMPYVDQNGYIIPAQFKKFMKAAAEDGINRKEFIDLYGDQLYIDETVSAEAYGLRPAELKLLGANNGGGSSDTSGGDEFGGA